MSQAGISSHAGDVRALVGMMESIKRMAGPAIGIVGRRWTGSQQANYRMRLQRIYNEAKRIQDDLMRRG
jgi:hypothetical protein